MTSLLIGGYTGDKGTGTGITVIDDDGAVSTVPAESPSWIARHPRLPVLYAVAEVDNGRVHAWSLDNGVPAAELGSSETGGAERAERRDPFRLETERHRRQFREAKANQSARKAWAPPFAGQATADFNAAVDAQANALIAFIQLQASNLKQNLALGYAEG